MGRFIVYIEGSYVKIEFPSLKIVSILANSVNPDEMPHNVAFHLGLHWLPKYPFRGFYMQLVNFRTAAVRFRYFYHCPEVH